MLNEVPVTSPVFRNRYLSVFCVLVFACVGESAFGQKNKDEEAGLRTYRVKSAAPTYHYPDRKFTLTFSEMVSMYEKEEYGSNFAQVGSMTKMDTQWSGSSGAEPKVWMADGQRIRRPATDTKIKLIQYDDKIFLKIESKKSPEKEDVSFELQYGGTYEAKILEGTMEGFQAGGRLAVTITDTDWERYLEDLTGAFRDEKFLGWNAANYKGQLVSGIEAAAKDPSTFPGGMAGVQAVRPAVENARVDVSPSVRSKPEVYVFEGDTLSVSCESLAVTLLYKISLGGSTPAPSGTGEKSWRDKMNFSVQGQFSPEDHKSHEPEDPLKGLPGKQWPGWWPGW